MPEKELNDMEIIAEAYKELPDYLKGKIDGYAEAIKERRVTGDEAKPGDNAASA